MQKNSIILGIILLLANIAAYLIFTSYSLFNCGLSTFIIIVNVCMVCFVSNIKLKEAFHYSLNILYSFAFLIEIILSIITRDQIENNIVLFLIILLIVSEIGLLLALNYISKKIK
jgi:hypothetical protein